MPSPDPTPRPGVPQGPGDTDPPPVSPSMLVQDQAAAFRIDQDEAGFLRHARRRLLTRLGIALVGLLAAAALLFSVAAIQAGSHPGPTTLPPPISVPAAGATGPTYVYTPVPAGTP